MVRSALAIPKLLRDRDIGGRTAGAQGILRHLLNPVSRKMGDSGGNSQTLEEQLLQVLMPVQCANTSSGDRSSRIFPAGSVRNSASGSYGPNFPARSVGPGSESTKRQSEALALFFCPHYD